MSVRNVSRRRAALAATLAGALSAAAIWIPSGVMGAQQAWPNKPAVIKQTGLKAE